MKKTIKRLPAAFIFLSLLIMPIYAASVDEANSTPPTISSDNTTFDTMINDILSASFTTLLASANDELAKYEDQKDIARGFANASAYSSRAATQQGYQDYSIFALTSGAMIGVQGPTWKTDYYTETDKVEDDLKEDGDIYAGIGAGVAFFNAGISGGFLNPFLIGFYFNVKFGQFAIKGDDFSDDLEGISVESRLMGLGVSYSLIETKSILIGLLTWRGISFSTGIYYNRTNIDFKVDLDPLTENRSDDLTPVGIPETITYNVTLDPSFLLNLDVKTYTIPLEVNTSVRLLWVLNFNLGAGVDFNFGSSKIEIEADGSTSTDIADSSTIAALHPEVRPGRVVINGKTKDTAPSLVDARVMTGIGINILPIKIDIPVTLYLDSGFALGLTVGIVW